MATEPEKDAAQAREQWIEAIAAQARELFSHLPEAEIDEDEQLEFKTDEQGRVIVRSRFAVYKLQEGRVWRWRELVDGGGYLEVFQSKHLVASKLVVSGWNPTEFPDLN